MSCSYRCICCAAIEDLDNKIKNLERQVSDLEDDLSDLEDDLADAKDEIDDLTYDLDCAERNANDNEDRADAYKSVVDDISSLIRSYVRDNGSTTLTEKIMYYVESV